MRCTFRTSRGQFDFYNGNTGTATASLNSDGDLTLGDEISLTGPFNKINSDPTLSLYTDSIYMYGSDPSFQFIQSPGPGGGTVRYDDSVDVFYISTGSDLQLYASGSAKLRSSGGFADIEVTGSGDVIVDPSISGLTEVRSDLEVDGDITLTSIFDSSLFFDRSIRKHTPTEAPAVVAHIKPGRAWVRDLLWGL